MLFSNPIKHGTTRALSVDIGQGPNVGVTFSVSDGSLITVDSSGVIGVVQDVTSQKEAFVFATETSTSLEKACVAMQVLPSAADLSTLLNLDGTLKSTSEATSAAYMPAVAATLTVDYSTPGSLFVSWANADITTQVNGFDPTGLALWNLDTGAFFAQFPLTASGSQIVDTEYETTTAGVHFSLKALSTHA
jgi:hypothetical protein